MVNLTLYIISVYWYKCPITSIESITDIILLISSYLLALHAQFV